MASVCSFFSLGRPRLQCALIIPSIIGCYDEKPERKKKNKKNMIPKPRILQILNSRVLGFQKHHGSEYEDA